MTSATLVELATAATDGDSAGGIEYVLDCLGDSADRIEFLRGLTERILVAEESPSVHADGEIARWLGSWILSCSLQRNARFLAADREADLLVAARKVGEGVSSAELRSRYAR